MKKIIIISGDQLVLIQKSYLKLEKNKQEFKKKFLLFQIINC